MSSAGTEVRSGRKWWAEKAVKVAESCLGQNTMIGTLVSGLLPEDLGQQGPVHVT